MSTRPKICQMVPTTFHGISSGRAISTRHSDAQAPPFGMLSATNTPSGTSMARMMAENRTWRPSASPIRSEWRRSSNQVRPFQKNSFFPNESWTE